MTLAGIEECRSADARVVGTQKAVNAQHAASNVSTGAGYDYGGLPGLQTAKTSGSGLSSFGVEQQTQIVTEFYRIKTGLAPVFGAGTKGDLPLYAHFVQEASTLTVA